MPEEQFQPRQVAYKIKIGDLSKGEYIEQEGWLPNYVKIEEKQVSRVNIIASVIDKQMGDSLSTITIDDGSEDIQVRAFNEESIKLGDINIGDVVIVIGRPRKYMNNRFFISYEIVKKLDPLWAKVRQKELGGENATFSTPQRDVHEKVSSKIHEESLEAPKIENVEIKEENIQGTKDNESKKRILDLIKNIDNGEGANIEDIKINSNLDQKEAEDIIQELIKAGEIYENIAGRVKLL